MMVSRILLRLPRCYGNVRRVGVVRFLSSRNEELVQLEILRKILLGDHTTIPPQKTTDPLGSSPFIINIAKFTENGEYTVKATKKSDLLSELNLQARDIRFSALTTLLVRRARIVLRLQHIKAIITENKAYLLDADHSEVKKILPELKEKLQTPETMPFEFQVLDVLLNNLFIDLEKSISKLDQAIKESLRDLLDPRLFSVDRGELHVLLQHSKSLSEFEAMVLDLKGTLEDILEYDDYMAEMHLTHLVQHGEDRDPDDVEDLENMLEWHAMQAEDMLSEVQQLKHLMEQSESVILINLDSQRNVMMRLSVQLEMGTFSATICGLVGVAFGMNLDSFLEETPYVFWCVTGLMVASTGLLWRKLLLYLSRNLNRPTKVSNVGLLQTDCNQRNKFSKWI
ncbi:magnesium transporter MRS2 homolog, mitochondrial-like [Dysidea avara]|uniref:magnesium transporter MRS2 homolog, mitochondrial-like n=1 Tax=Dysidea avara TaxID=196820 RepID=UPI00332DD044